MTCRTTVDWWAFRSQGEPLGVLEACRPAFGDALGQALKLRPRGRGWQGYEQSADLLLADMPVGLLAYGGDAQRGWVHTSLTGKACAWVEDWDRALEAAEALPGYNARRVDIALTTTDGSVGHDGVLAAYRAGEFQPAGGGRPPTCRQIVGESPTDGRTIYVGSRERDKFFRGYEKGYELAQGLFEKGMQVTHVDGVPIEDMYRLELELKAKTADLPADLIERRDQYFAGAYPYLGRVLEVEPEILVMRRERGPQLDLARALGNIRRQYGATLFTALVAHHGDFGAVWEKVCGTTHNAALVEAGVLMVDHG